jgi:hypothetical protein
MLSVGRESKKEILYNFSDAEIGILASAPSVDHLRVRQCVFWRAMGANVAEAARR